MAFNYQQSNTPALNATAPPVVLKIDSTLITATTPTFPLMRSLIERIEGLTTDGLLSITSQTTISNNNIQRKLAEYAGFYIDRTVPASPVLSFDARTNYDNGNNADSAVLSNTAQPNKSIHKFTYYILFRIFPLISRRATTLNDFTDAQIIARFNEFLEDVNNLRLCAKADGITPNIRRLCITGEEEMYYPKKVKVDVTTLVDNTDYTITINVSSSTYTATFHYNQASFDNDDDIRRMGIAEGLCQAAITQGTVLTCQHKNGSNGRSHFLITAPDFVTDFTITPGANLTLEIVHDLPVIPTYGNAGNPAIITDDYLSLSSYNKAGLPMHDLYKDEAFDADGSTIAPAHLYLTGTIETPYITAWSRPRKSRPFWVYPGSAPEINATVANGFYDIAVLPLVTTDLYIPERNNSQNFSRYAYVTSAGGVGPDVPPAGFSYIFFNIEGFRIVDQPVDINLINSPNAASPDTSTTVTTQVLISDFDPIRIDPPPHQSATLALYRVGTTERYYPDYKNFENLYTNQVYVNADHTYYVKVLRKTFITNARFKVPNNSGLTQADLLAANHRYPIYRNAAGTYYLRYPRVGLTVAATGDTGHSGCTLGIGIDIGSARGGTPDLDTYLNATSEAWVPLTNAQKLVLYGQRVALNTNIAAKIREWILNRPFFDSLDLNSGKNNYTKAINATIPFLNALYYIDPKTGLQTDTPVILNFDDGNTIISLSLMNIFELAAMTLILWNGPGNVYFNGPTDNGHTYVNRCSEFANAINKHDHHLLIQAVTNIPTSNNNRGHVLTLLDNEYVKDYYRTVHLCHIT